MRSLVGLLACWVVVSAMAGLSGPGPSLTLTRAGVSHRFTAAQLLARPDAAEVAIPHDVSYGGAARYRAVPLLSLLAELPPDAGADTLEARSTDGFVAQIPLSLVKRAAAGGGIALIAVEPPGRPWPKLPGKPEGAGPFYLVWRYPERSGVASEQWPYQLASLAAVESPAHRWPQLAADPTLPADAPARRGERLFAANCLSCHRLNGGGAGEIGPDLGAPMNATDYLTLKGLRALIRDPRAVRRWPRQQMPGFAPDALSDGDLDALIAYLRQAKQPAVRGHEPKPSQRRPVPVSARTRD